MTPLLTDQLDPKLYLTGRRGRRDDLASAVDCGTLSVEESAVFKRGSQLGMVEDVEDLGAELKIQILANPPQRIFLEKSDVERLQTGTEDRVAAEVTQHV